MIWWEGKKGKHIKKVRGGREEVKKGDSVKKVKGEREEEEAGKKKGLGEGGTVEGECY